MTPQNGEVEFGVCAWRGWDVGGDVGGWGCDLVPVLGAWVLAVVLGGRGVGGGVGCGGGGVPGMGVGVGVGEGAEGAGVLWWHYCEVVVVMCDWSRCRAIDSSRC